MIVALTALVVALGGTSYAAIELPKNSVGPQQIKTNAVTSTKVKNGSLKPRDFASGQIPTGTALAYGTILPSGTVDDDRSKEILVAAHRDGSGLYCLIVPPEANLLIAQIDLSTSSTGDDIFSTLNPASVQLRCPPGSSNAVISTTNGGFLQGVDRLITVLVY